MSIRVDFMPQRRWVHLWMVAAVVCAALVSATTLLVLQNGRQAQVATSRAAAARLQAKALGMQTQKAAEAEKTDAGLVGLRVASTLLRLDVNPVFSVLENIAEPGARLAAVQFDAHSQQIRLEYNVESLSHAATLTTSLNAGYDAPPWRLEAVTGVDSAHAPPHGGAAMRASWSSRLGLLK
jgi:hypothetical protein